jgi:hypothetical protein
MSNSVRRQPTAFQRRSSVTLRQPAPLLAELTVDGQRAGNAAIKQDWIDRFVTEAESARRRLYTSPHGVPPRPETVDRLGLPAAAFGRSIRSSLADS